MAREFKILYFVYTLRNKMKRNLESKNFILKDIMKPIFKEFCCPQCGELRYINVKGICFDCNNENNLLSLAEQRKLHQKLNMVITSLSIESYN